MLNTVRSLSFLLLVTLSAPAFADPSELIAGGCAGEYRKQIRRTELAIGLGPIVGAAGLVGSGMLSLGWEYGGWTTLKATLGPSLTSAAGTAINFVLPTGIALGALTYEGIMIGRLIKTIHAHNLILGLYQEGKNRQLDRLLRRLRKKGSHLSREEVVARLIQADQERTLCNGSLGRRKLAGLKDIERMFLTGKSQPSSESAHKKGDLDPTPTTFTILPGKLHKGGILTTTASNSDIPGMMRVQIDYEIIKKNLVPIPTGYLSGSYTQILPEEFLQEGGYLELEQVGAIEAEGTTIIHQGRAPYRNHNDAHLIQIIPNNGKSEIHLIYHPSIPGLGWDQVKLILHTGVPLLGDYWIEGALRTGS